jgi:hypothetical protein
LAFHLEAWKNMWLWYGYWFCGLYNNNM